MADEQSDVKTNIFRKLKIAQDDRARASTWINNVLQYAMPLENRLGTDASTPRSPDEQSDIFDTTLQETLSDFGSDMSHLFTPRHEKWVKFELTKTLTQAEQVKYQKDVDAVSDQLFEEIEKSNFYESAGEAYNNWGISLMAIAINSGGLNKPIDCQPIPMNELLVCRGANGNFDAIFREFGKMTEEDMRLVWPNVFDKVKPEEKNKAVKPIEAWVRNYSDPTIEAWDYFILVGKEIRLQKFFKGEGSCGIIVCPWRKKSNTAWAAGPAYTALPTARLLDELNYLGLKALNRDLDPVVSYQEDGILNPEGGIDAGTWLARAPGSDAPVPIESKARTDLAIFERTRLERKIKAQLYQDRPDQSGKTPPTATQWLDEKAWNTRRMELPRDLATNLWVVPIINRFSWLMEKAGKKLGFQAGKEFIQLKPITPLSKARDIEDINTTMQVIGWTQMILNLEQIPNNPIDVLSTIQAIKITASERHIEFKSPEQMQAQQMLAMAAQAAPAMQMIGQSGMGGQDVQQ